MVGSEWITALLSPSQGWDAIRRWERRVRKVRSNRVDA
jgi:hypothetical protein